MALLAVVATARAQRAVPPSVLGPPLLLRLEGVIEPTRAAAEGKGFAVVSLGFRGSDAQRWLAVTEARTVGGDHPLDGKDVLALVAPFTPNLLVTGSDDAVTRLRDAPADARVVVEGLVDQSARTYLLRRVDVAATEPGKPHSGRRVLDENSLDAANRPARQCTSAPVAACTANGGQKGLRCNRSPSARCSRSSV
ncbi:MAG TPA: hypothetical protein VKA21_09150 [Candidatus Binatia bacterium]|nr:hypothetical protein [Candidatus Binatia bacterium]